MASREKDLSEQIQDLITSQQRAERLAKVLLRTAHEDGLSFGLDYNYLDDDIAHLLGRLRYMQRVTLRWEERQTRQAVEKSASVANAPHTKRAKRHAT
jgi:hypothetical protein